MVSLGAGHGAVGSISGCWLGVCAPVPPRPCSPHLGVPQPQDHRRHRLSCGAFHRHRHHHRLLLHVLLLLLVPAPAALPHPPARPGNPPVQLPPCSSSSSRPRGPQNWPYASAAWLHSHGYVPPARPCCPVPHVLLRPPCLLPHSSTTTLRPGTAQLPWSISPRGDPCARRRPAGPGWGPLGTPLALGGCTSWHWIQLFPATLR